MDSPDKQNLPDDPKPCIHPATMSAEEFELSDRWADLAKETSKSDRYTFAEAYAAYKTERPPDGDSGPLIMRYRQDAESALKELRHVLKLADEAEKRLIHLGNSLREFLKGVDPRI